jgi:NRAMP (natural resistance-associated macrophage protein)-like metal ion transporter
MVKRIRKFFRNLGPGLITGASDNDPSGIVTYSQTGAQFGYKQLWLSVYMYPLLMAVQETCGRIGIVTDKGLAGVIREHFPRSILTTAVVLLLVANTINIGADLGAMAATVQLLIPGNFTLILLIITVTTLMLEIFTSYRLYAKYLKWLAITLFAYVITAVLVRQDWGSVATHLAIPTIQLGQGFLLNIVAILGTSISPYLFFWQAGEEVEEQVLAGRIKRMGMHIPTRRPELDRMKVDVRAGMILSNAAMFFIVLTLAGTLFSAHTFTINTATQAAQALKPVAGSAAVLIFAIGIIGTGMLAIPVLAGSAAYALAEAFGWREGLYNKFRQAHGFYGVITVATLVGLIVNFVGVDPIRMLYYSAVINGLLAPPLLLLILLVGNDRRVMGRFTNSAYTNTMGWITFLVMLLAAVALIFSFLG